MKLKLHLVILFVVAFSQAEVLQEPLAQVLMPFETAKIASVARSNLNLGIVYTGDRVLYRAYVYRPLIANSVQYEDVVYRGNAYVRISAIRALEVGATQNATARVIAGGVGFTYATIRFQSARGWGYYYLLEIWGR